MQAVTTLNGGAMSVTPPPRAGASSSVGTLAEGANMHMGLQGTVGMHGLHIVLLSCYEGGKAARSGDENIAIVRKWCIIANAIELFQ